MKKFILLTSVFLASAFYVSAQQVKGILKDSADHSPLMIATVSVLKTDSTTVVAETISNEQGEFSFRNIPAGNYFLSVSYIGYKTLMKRFSMGTSTYDFGNIDIAKTAEVLTTVVIDGTPPPVRMKGDTTEITAAQFKVNPDANVEDLIKKMPGITVDKQGKVTAHGESVQKVTVDGRDFFGDDAAAALRNLPSEVVDKIQIFDRLSDQAQLTGFDDGNTTKSINVVTKANMRQGNFGRIYAGYGTDDKYMGGGNISFFNNARRISIVGLTNNINQQNFSSEDMTNMGGGRGGIGGGGRGGFGGGGGFNVGPQSGIAKTNALGLNFSDVWGKKVEVSGSYFFNNRNLSNTQITNTQFLNPDNKSFYDEDAVSQNTNNSNRLNLRVKYTIDSNNTIQLRSGASFNGNKSTNSILGLMTGEDHSQLLSKTDNMLRNNSDGYQINSGLLYSHKFAKPGRSISMDFSTNLSKNSGANYNYALNEYYKMNVVAEETNRFTDNENNTNNYRINLEYTEPIAPKWQMQVNYNPSFQKSFADQRAYDFDSSHMGYTHFRDSLSNKFENTYNTHNTGITIRRGDRDNMVSVGVSYQYSELMSDRTFPSVTHIDHSYNNILANAFARLKLGTYSQLRLSYRSSVRSPSVTQLQDVINTTNPLFYSTGNANLQQQYDNRIFGRFSYANRVSGNSFFAGFFMTNTNNYISNATFTAKSDSTLSQGIILHEGTQLSKPVNLDGYYSVNSFVNFSIPVKFIKSNLNLNGGVGYSRQPGMVDYIKNISNNYNYNVGAVLASNISEYIDFNLSYSINFNNVENSINPRNNNDYQAQSAGASVNLLTKKGTFFQTDMSHESYSGLSAGYNQSYWLWNASVGQKFLKGQKGELKLTVFDLLNQNKSITRNVTATQIQDLKNQVTQQYFMLTFTYRLKNFGKPQSGSRGGGMDGARPMMPGRNMMGH